MDILLKRYEELLIRLDKSEEWLIKNNYNIYEHIDAIASKYHFNKLSLERKNRIDNIFNRITA